ncbi:hypothetical protein B0H14DRAFT_2593730 [Mycena olivaceomarginata]|nr:hypothetical protein B0H14DRAFT_2593730 [Mycena olivaceomarginata]
MRFLSLACFLAAVTAAYAGTIEMRQGCPGTKVCPTNTVLICCKGVNCVIEFDVRIFNVFTLAHSLPDCESAGRHTSREDTRARPRGRKAALELNPWKHSWDFSSRSRLKRPIKLERLESLEPPMVSPTVTRAIHLLESTQVGARLYKPL